jgi:hypothetical protein
MGFKSLLPVSYCVSKSIGRGLRPCSLRHGKLFVGADGRKRANCFKPEYVNIFLVCRYLFFQDVGDGGEAPPPPQAKHAK